MQGIIKIKEDTLKASPFILFCSSNSNNKYLFVIRT